MCLNISSGVASLGRLARSRSERSFDFWNNEDDALYDSP